MPSPEEILRGLHEIANTWRLLSVVWHGYFLILLLGFVGGARPTRRVAGIMLVLPLLSVSTLAWVHGNPFNGTFFAALGLVLFATCLRWPAGRIQASPGWLAISGSLMVAFGWVYPHFLDTPSSLSYLYAAPTGLVPCPTLSIVIGLSLLVSGLSSAPWSVVLAAAGMFYGLYGALRLGVAIDSVLLAGAVWTLVAVFSGSIGAPDDSERRSSSDDGIR